MIFELTATTPVNCPSMSSCAILCPFGFRKDENGCEKCDCHKPCQVIY